MNLNEGSAFFFPIIKMNVSSKYINFCSISLLITTFGITLANDDIHSVTINSEIA